MVRPPGIPALVVSRKGVGDRVRRLESSQAGGKSCGSNGRSWGECWAELGSPRSWRPHWRPRRQARIRMRRLTRPNRRLGAEHDRIRGTASPLKTARTPGPTSLRVSEKDSRTRRTRQFCEACVRNSTTGPGQRGTGRLLKSARSTSPAATPCTPPPASPNAPDLLLTCNRPARPSPSRASASR